MRLRDESKWQEFLTANPPPPGLERDPATWPGYQEMTEEQRDHGYGFTVVLFAERWAEAMEAVLRADPTSTVAGVAQRCASDADKSLGNWGITGFQYGAAVSVLAQCWEHGEELRVWHNIDTQIGDEGERANKKGTVLNPALLNIEG